MSICRNAACILSRQLHAVHPWALRTAFGSILWGCLCLGVKNEKYGHSRFLTVCKYCNCWHLLTLARALNARCGA